MSLLFLRRYVADRRGTVVLLGLLGILTSGINVAGWRLVGDAIDNGMRAHNDRRLVIDVAIYVVIAVFGWIFGAILIRGLATIGQLIVVRLRDHLFGHLTTLSLRYFGEQRTGWIISRMTNDIDALSDVLGEGLATVTFNVFTLFVSIVGLFLLDWRLALITLVVLPPTIAVSRWFQLRSGVAFADVRTRISALTAQVAESIAGMAVVQAYNREEAFRDEFLALNRENERANRHAQNLSSVFFPAIELCGVVASIAVLLLGASLHAGGSLQIGTLIAFMGLVQLVFQPLQELSELYGQVQSAAAAMDKIKGVLDAEAELPHTAGAETPARISGHLALQGVSFAYGKEPVLRSIDLEIAPGQVLAVVGGSGGGKSTLARLVARFYDPQQGTVTIDGIDLRSLDLAGYRRQLGVVLQDPFLFAGTIADNLRFAAPEASDEEVRQTAEAIGLAHVLRRFSDGLAHHVREGGSGLSAGERQLISIGRALLADPRILILDEATSNIDRPTEVLIERALDRLLSGRTSLIIAHRLATVMRADLLIVLDHGRIIERGRPRELLERDGPFRHLARELAAPSTEQALS